MKQNIFMFQIKQNICITLSLRNGRNEKRKIKTTTTISKSNYDIDIKSAKQYYIHHII